MIPVLRERQPGCRGGVAAILLAALLPAAAAVDSGRHRPRDPDVVASLAFRPVPGDVAANRRTLASLISDASRLGAQYLVTPELATVGNVDGACDPERRLAEPVPGPSTAWLGEQARRHRLWASFSLLERDPDGPCFVTAVLVGPDGGIHQRARKVLVRDGADGGAAPGSFRDATDSVDADDVRIGIVSADDIVAGVPRLAQRGAQIVLVNAGDPGEDAGGLASRLAALAAEHAVAIAAAGPPCPSQGACATGVFGSSATVRAAPQGAVCLATVAHRVPWHVPSALGLPATVPVPSTQSGSDEIAELGRRLFTDRGLSSSGTVACATCHDPQRFFTNGKPRGVGVYGRETKRNVPSLLNVAFRPLLQWDGYASSVESFVKYPLSSVTEMDFHYLDKVVGYVRGRPDYVAAFRTSMGAETIEFEQVAAALAAYQRTLISGRSAFDRYMYGGERSALDPAARRGLELFTGRAGCATCHAITSRHALFTDFKYHRLGIGYDADAGKYRDIGLGGISTNDFSGLFLTPSLRNVTRTAPYMHDGSLASLDDVLAFYERGITGDPFRAALRPLALSPADRRDIIAFLESLTGDQRYDAEGRRLPPALSTHRTSPPIAPQRGGGRP